MLMPDASKAADWGGRERGSREVLRGSKGSRGSRLEAGISAGLRFVVVVLLLLVRRVASAGWRKEGELRGVARLVQAARDAPGEGEGGFLGVGSGSGEGERGGVERRAGLRRLSRALRCFVLGRAS